MLDDFGHELGVVESKLDTTLKKVSKVLHISNGKILPIAFNFFYFCNISCFYFNFNYFFFFFFVPKDMNLSFLNPWVLCPLMDLAAHLFFLICSYHSMALMRKKEKKIKIRIQKIFSLNLQEGLHISHDIIVTNDLLSASKA